MGTPRTYEISRAYEYEMCESNLRSHATSLSVVSLESNFQKLHAVTSCAILSEWKEKLYVSLAELFLESKTENLEWNEISAFHAEDFIRNLPFNIKSPVLSMEAEGDILIEWYKKNENKEPTIFSIILGSENYIYSLLEYGIPKTHGVANYCKGSREMILSTVRKQFSINLDNARFKF